MKNNLELVEFIYANKKKYKHRVAPRHMKNDAEDLLHDVIVNLLRKPTLTVDKHEQFLAVSMRNMRIYKGTLLKNAPVVETNENDDCTIPDYCIGYRAKLTQAINNLSPKQKSIILDTLEGLSLKDIAKYSKQNLNSVGTNYKAALKNLKKALVYGKT